MSDSMTINSKILVIDDSIFILRAVHEMLKDRYIVLTAQSAAEAYSVLNDVQPDIILLDLEMPAVDGYEVLERLKSTPVWRNIPVIFLTGISDREKEEKALNMGAVDYILKPISVGVLKKRIQMHLELNAYHKNLESMVNIKTNELLKTRDLILDILANITTYRDSDTGAHIIRTTNYIKLIAERLLVTNNPNYRISPTYANDIIKSAKLHDIGKIAIPDEILHKTASLTPTEFETIKLHTTFGSQMIDHAINNSESDVSFLITAREIILYHHEWWNGNGYPERLSGKDIPISARMMAIADVYDALISQRPYKDPLPHDNALRIMRKGIGTHFDSELMDIIEELFPEFEKVARTFRDE